MRRRARLSAALIVTVLGTGLLAATPSATASVERELVGTQPRATVAAQVSPGGAQARRASKYPSKITKVTATPGPRAGEVTFRWRTDGTRSARFELETSLSPFSTVKSKGLPRKGRNFRVFTFKRSLRKATLTAAQVRSAGAAPGTGNHLMFRLFNVKKYRGKLVRREYGYINTIRPQGQSATGTGARLRVASWNLRAAGLDPANGPRSWGQRQGQVARGIGEQQPTIFATQETTSDMASQLAQTLDARGLGRYQPVQRDRLASGDSLLNRIWYDNDQLRLVSNCPEQTYQCVWKLPENGRAHHAVFEVRDTGEQFRFVSVHLKVGSSAAAQDLRVRQAAVVRQAVEALDGSGVPTIVAGDFNAHQVLMNDTPHTEFTRAGGWFDAAGAAKATGWEYGTVNAYAAGGQKPSATGFGARLDVILLRGMTGADLHRNVLTPGGNGYGSDHNMVLADLRLPGPPPQLP